MNQEILYALALRLVPGISLNTAKKLIAQYLSAQNVWHNLDEIFKTAVAPVSKDKLNKIYAKSESEIEWLVKNNYQVYYYNSPEYPKLLKETLDSPLLLYADGHFNWNDFKFVSIVGTRKMTNYGKKFIQDLVEELSKYPVCIVSGLASGCDITAHVAAIDNKLPTIAVMGTPIDKVYPEINRKYLDTIKANGGLITETASFQAIRPENFLMRNRIIAGLCECTIVVESDYKGGSLTTAKYANNYNREVFALPGRTTDKLSNGSNHLIHTYQAKMILSARDIVEYLNLDVVKNKPIQKKLFIEITEKEKIIYDIILEKNRVHIDEIALFSNQPTYVLMPELLSLELKGIIKNLPGKYFELDS